MDAYPTFASLIDALGGYAALARIIEKPIGTASAMKTRDVIPPAYWQAIVQAAAEAGLKDVTHELLTRLYAQKRTAERAA